MIGNALGSTGFRLTDLPLFGFSLLVGLWLVRTRRRGPRSLRSRFARITLGLLAFAPFLMLGSAFLAARLNAPAALADGPSSLKQVVNLGSRINTTRRESEPTFTADGRTMYFNCYDADICVSHLDGTWEDGDWSAPERLGPSISTGYFEVEPLVNGAGDKLYFQSNRPAGSLERNLLLSPFVANSFFLVNYLAEAKLGLPLLGGLGLGDVWVSYRVDGAWSEPVNLREAPDEPPVNTPYHDHCLSFSADGSEAFWTSTRPGGFGGNDIWTSRRVDGKWTAPENLGPGVNGPGDEHHSIPTPDGKSLYVTTLRDGGYGGEDIYVSSRDTKGGWGPLVNLGPIVNGPGDDRCAAWTPDGRIFLFDSTRGAGFGSLDLWWIYMSDLPGQPPAAASLPLGP
jgi:hypothetical protein